MDITEISKEQIKVLEDYFQAVSKVFNKGGLVKRMIRKIRESPSDEDAMGHYKKLMNINLSLRFYFYRKVEDKVKAIREITDTLDYFEVDYPPLRDSIIKQFFFFE